MRRRVHLHDQIGRWRIGGLLCRARPSWHEINAARQYLAQRYCFGQLCHSAPLFFVLGNHDGESPRGRGDETDALAVWSNQIRKRHFPNPIPDAFYSGNSVKHPEAGLLQDYYAFEWGDAQFIMLDPF